MKLDLSNVPEGIAYGGPSIGDVYPSLGGANRQARWKVIVGISGGTVHFLTFDENGEVCGSTSYGLHAVEKRYRVGRVTNLGPLHVEWDGAP